MGKNNKKGFSFKNLPIRKKLIISHGLIIIISCIINVYCLSGLKSTTDYIKGLYDGPMTSVDLVGDLMYGTADLQRTMVWSHLRREERDYAEFEKEVDENINLMLNAIEVMEKSLLTENEKAKLAEIKKLVQTCIDEKESIMSDIKEHKYEEALATYLNYREYINQIKDSSEELNEAIRAVGLTYEEDAVADANKMTIITLISIVIGILIIAVLVFKITKMIATPVKQLMDASHELYNGNMKADMITYEAKDELGELAESMRGTMQTLDSYVDEISSILRVMATGDLTKDGNAITEFRGQFADIKVSLLQILKSFNSTLNDIYVASDQVNEGSNQVAEGAQVLSNGAGAQSESVEELSATVIDISDQVNKTAENATVALHKVDETGEQVEICNKKMQEMTEAMEEITQQSNEISKIVKTIEDIAFQTNILALNAAVEAARAGEAGKGFAVVADEVRNLAGKSAEASKNTTDLISSTVRAVTKGTKILGATAETLDNVVDSARSVFGLVGEIAEAANKEAEALSQVSEGIEQISSVVQTTSSTAQQSAATSEELSSQAEMLQKLINNFKLYEVNYNKPNNFDIDTNLVLKKLTENTDFKY